MIDNVFMLVVDFSMGAVVFYEYAYGHGGDLCEKCIDQCNLNAKILCDDYCSVNIYAYDDKPIVM